MDCKEIKEKLYLFAGGGMDGDESRLVDEHIGGCAACARVLDNELKLDALLRSGIPKAEAPAGLKAAVLNNLPDPKPNLFGRIAFLPKPVIVPALAVMLLAVFLFPVLMRQADVGPVFAESVSSHVRFTGGDLPLGIASDDPSEIRDWFYGRLDFEVLVPDLSRSGYSLSGAGVCRIRGSESAWIVYEKEASYISVFLIDAARMKLPGAGTASGGDIVYAESARGHQCVLCICAKGCPVARVFVSDLPGRELMEIVESKCEYCELH